MHRITDDHLVSHWTSSYIGMFELTERTQKDDLGKRVKKGPVMI